MNLSICKPVAGSSRLDGIPIKNGISSSRRTFELDVLRGIAILIVVLNHALRQCHNPGLFSPLVVGFNNFGWSGVDLFFVLSGFLIGNILLQEIKSSGSLDLWRFYIRRDFRIWPAYYAFIFGCIAFYSILGQFPKSAWQYLPLSMVFMQNWSSMFPLPTTGHTWSVCVEEHFYLVLPLLLLFLLRTVSFHRLPKIILGIALFCLASRSIQLFYGVSGAHSFIVPEFWANSFNRIDALLSGVLLAYVYVFKPLTWSYWGQKRNLLLFLGVVSLMPMLFGDPFHDRIALAFIGSIGLTMTYCGYACIMLALLNLPDRTKQLFSQNRIARVIAWIGYYSYTIYLWHFFLLAGFSQLFSLHWHNLMMFSVDIVSSIAPIGACFVSVMLIEKPALKLRDRLFPAKTKVLTATPAIKEPPKADLQGTLVSLVIGD